jgi:outer membrane receptor protein involved in Fe transport
MLYRYRILMMVIFILLCQLTVCQEVVLKGRVRHANTYTEIPDVNVYIQNTTTGTMTDLKGFFALEITKVTADMMVVFEHVAYDTLIVSLAKAQETDNFYLTPRLIQLPDITVESQSEQSDFLKDIPQPHTIIEARSFEMQGYMDAGDLLRSEQSVAVDEDLSGKKTIAIRGGNPDDVIVLYNGIRMNNLYDNIFDLSLINLDEIKQIEIIKGSNTSLYGSEAFSGVVNVVPRMYRNYNIRFMQRIGTYAAGDWNLQLNRNFFNKLNLSYGYKKGAYQRQYADETALKNQSENHTATLYYDTGKPDQDEQTGLGFLFLNSNLKYNNDRYQEFLNNQHNLLSLRYTGNIWTMRNWLLAASYQQYNNDEQIVVPVGTFDKHFFNTAVSFDIEKKVVLRPAEVLFSYQFETNDLDYQEIRNNPDELALGAESARFTRNKHGIVSILKFHAPTGSDFFNTSDINFSYRYDNVKDEAKEISFRGTYPDFSTPYYPENDWQESTFKFSSQLAGKNRNFAFDGFINYGSNIKFPSIYQQLSLPVSGLNDQAVLQPERNNGLEIAANLTKDLGDITILSGWLLQANYFRNYYENKFRMYYRPGIPIAFYDNVPTANIFGLDFKGSLFFIRKKLSVTIGTSQYNIPEKSAFPFKYESKTILNASFDHAGYALKFDGFIEGPQAGWIRDTNGRYTSISLPGYTNFDLHLGKSLELIHLKFFANLTLRNALDNKTELEGLAIRDRRVYLSFGVQY